MSYSARHSALHFIDLRSGYHQIRLDQESVFLLVFSTIYGHFEFLALPSGLTSAPATLMIRLSEVVADYLDKFVIMYFGDILVYSESTDDHVEHLQTVLDLLRIHKLYGKFSKFVFAAIENL